MATYQVKYQRNAARERDWLCHTYGDSFRHGYSAWLTELSEDLAQGRDDAHFDLQEVLDAIEKENLSNWHRSYKRFLEAGYRDKLRALLAVLRNRRPPWQLRGAARVIMGLDGLVLINVNLVLDVSDTDGLLVIRQVLHHAL
jgi:hypothetical protein